MKMELHSCQPAAVRLVAYQGKHASDYDSDCISVGWQHWISRRLELCLVIAMMNCLGWRASQSSEVNSLFSASGGHSHSGFAKRGRGIISRDLLMLWKQSTVSSPYCFQSRHYN